MRRINHCGGSGEAGPSPPDWGQRENEKVRMGRWGQEKMIQGGGETLAQGQQRALEERPKEREGPRGREGAKTEERELQKKVDRREAERE